MRLHPDKGGDPDDFKELQRAFEVTMIGHLSGWTWGEDPGCVDICIHNVSIHYTKCMVHTVHTIRLWCCSCDSRLP